MDTSVAWINDYLDRPADADEQAELLTHAGFPLEGREDLDGDVRQDFEMTSNRGDCTSHIGMAREIAAVSGRSLVRPDIDCPTGGEDVSTFASLDNQAPDACPLYTGRVITGITVAPGTGHIAQRLLARGDIPRSNVVDATNFVLFETGQPTHVFDLDTLAGGRIEVRMARAGETFLPIGEDAVEIELDGSELVIADAEKPVALAGVKGGALTAVTDKTTNILVEAATFDPVAVRHTSRLHNISSDSSFRFERGVAPGQVDHCAQRLCRIILETAGGTLAPGVLRDGAPLPEQLVVSMRPARCRSILGLDLDDQTQTEMLDRLGFQPRLEDGVITVTVPIHRGDIHREIDLIEEIMRMHGFADMPVNDTITIRAAQADPEHRAIEAMTSALVADGFVETVTHTLTTEEAAMPFAGDAGLVTLVENRAGAESVLRPSIVCSLLRVARHNIDHGVTDIRLAELGSVFSRPSSGSGHDEHRELAILMGADEAEGIRPIRGILDHVVDRMSQGQSVVDVTPADAPGWLSPAGTVCLDGTPIGAIGRITDSVAGGFGVNDRSLLAAALCVDGILSREYGDRSATRLPEFPAMARDVSAVVDEDVSWNAIRDVVEGLSLEHLEAVEFVTTFRGPSLAPGTKSVTARLRFRSWDRTLTRDDVEPSMHRAIEALEQSVSATIRT